MKCKYPPCENDAEPFHDGYCCQDHCWRHTRERAIQGQQSTFQHFMGEKPKKMNGHDKH